MVIVGRIMTQVMAGNIPGSIAVTAPFSAYFSADKQNFAPMLLYVIHV
jgi:hypothetical protein